MVGQNLLNGTTLKRQKNYEIESKYLELTFVESELKKNHGVKVGNMATHRNGIDGNIRLKTILRTGWHLMKRNKPAGWLGDGRRGRT